MVPESINRYAGIAVHADGLRIHYILDIAEILAYAIPKNVIAKTVTGNSVRKRSWHIILWLPMSFAKSCMSIKHPCTWRGIDCKI
jgi:hypothetical protein